MFTVSSANSSSIAACPSNPVCCRSPVRAATASNSRPALDVIRDEAWCQETFIPIIQKRGAAVIERAQPLYRRVGSVGFHWFMQTVVGLAGIQDTQCGFKFFQHAAAKELFRRQKIDGYMFDVEILAIARRLGYRIEQLPIRWRDDADSRLNLVSGNLRNVRDIFRIGREHRFGGRLQ